MLEVNKFLIKLFCQKVGTDQFGNDYYLGKSKNQNNKNHPNRKRYVLYNGIDESSKVPPMWHGWLHYLSDDVPPPGGSHINYEWQREHLPNLTGTKHAYDPAEPRYINKESYSSWKPE